MSDRRPRERVPPLELDAPETMAEWFEEPELSFAGGRRHVDPKVGISLYGPRSLGTVRHKSEVHVGFIGTAEPVAYARALYERSRKGWDGDGSHVPFPGFKADRGYRCDLKTGDALVEHISRKESVAIDGIRSGRERFEEMVGTLKGQDGAPDPEGPPAGLRRSGPSQDLFKRCRAVDYKVKGAGRSTVTCAGPLRRWPWSSGCRHNTAPCDHGARAHQPGARPRFHDRLEPPYWRVLQGRRPALGPGRAAAHSCIWA